MSPDYSWAYFNLGSICYEENDYDKAQEYLQKTLELNPKDDGASIILSKIYAKDERFDEAIELLNSSIGFNPYNGDVHYTLAHMYKEIGDLENYKTHLQEAMNNQSTLTYSLKQLQSEWNSL